MPKIGKCKIFGRPNFYGGSKYTHISTINMYRFIKIRHDIIRQCHGNYKEMKKFNYKLEFDIFRNSTLKKLGVQRGSLGLGQGLSRNASSVSFGHAKHCFLTVWTPKILCLNLLKMTFLRR